MQLYYPSKLASFGPIKTWFAISETTLFILWFLKISAKMAYMTLTTTLIFYFLFWSTKYINRASFNSDDIQYSSWHKS